MRPQILPIEPTILPGIEPGIKRSDAANYILSKTYARRLGDNLPRRDILIGLAGGLACTAYPFRKANALPWARVTLAGVRLAAKAFPLFASTIGLILGDNPEDDQLTGGMMFTVFNDNEDSEGSKFLKYSFPAQTRFKFEFRSGPAASTRGDKTLHVASSGDSQDGDYNTQTDFQAT